MHSHRFTIEQVRAFWDKVAPRYDEVNAGLSWTHSERFLTMQHFLPRQPRQVVTNVWSRTGGAVPYIRQVCPDAILTNFEVSSTMLAMARSRYPDEVFLPTDLHDLQGDTESQDAVVSLETLEHVPDPLHFLLECHRLLKVGGRLILSAPPAWCEPMLRLYDRLFDNHGEGPHKFPTVRSVLNALEACGFSVLTHRGTVLLPVGPQWAKRAAEWLQQRVLRHLGTNRLGIRHFYIAEKLQSRDPTWGRLLNEVIQPGLCSHCGTCVGLSAGKLQFDDLDRQCLPQIAQPGCLPPVCYEACPQVHASYPEMTSAVFTKRIQPSELKSIRQVPAATAREPAVNPVSHAPTPENVGPASPYFGHYRRLLIAHSTDEDIRRKGASGGVLSAALIHLLQTGRISGAVVLAMHRQYPWRAVPTIARSRGEILAAAQSKYVISPVNTILADLSKEVDPLAFVGLPHQVFSIRRLQRLGHPSVAPIQYILGPFFGNELYGSAVESFLRKFGASRNDVVKLSYRDGEWPGSMKAWLCDGRVIEMPKFHANYLIPFHVSDNSLLSHDLTNELTDLSGGDAWAPAYEQRRQGFSLVVTRTAQGDSLIKEMEQDGSLWVQEIDEPEAIAMQSHGLDFKKRGSLLRLERRARAGLRSVDFGLTTPQVSAGRAFFEFVLSALFRVCSHPLARRAADAMPNRLIGPMFQWFRTLWKASTRHVKRTGLAPNAPPLTKD